MSKWRKHVTSGGYAEQPEDGQQIVQAIGSRGSNLIEVRARAPPLLIVCCSNRFDRVSSSDAD